VNGPLIQEFKNNRLKQVLPGAPGSFITWTSPILSTKVASKNKPAGSDRLTCPYVNGFIQAKFLDKSIFESDATITAMLMGEYASIPAVFGDLGIQSKSFSFIAPTSRAEALTFYQANGALIFNQFATFSNCAQNVYIKVTIAQDSGTELQPPVPVDVVFSGAIVASLR
jgi:hypothetical protein